jgi:hypothetical protein
MYEHPAYIRAPQRTTPVGFGSPTSDSNAGFLSFWLFCICCFAFFTKKMQKKRQKKKSHPKYNIRA